MNTFAIILIVAASALVDLATRARVDRQTRALEFAG